MCQSTQLPLAKLQRRDPGGKTLTVYLLTKRLQRLDLPASSWVLETQQESKRENCPSFKELTVWGTVKDMQIWEGFLGNLELVAREGLS